MIGERSKWQRVYLQLQVMASLQRIFIQHSSSSAQYCTVVQAVQARCSKSSAAGRLTCIGRPDVLSAVTIPALPVSVIFFKIFYHICRSIVQTPRGWMKFKMRQMAEVQ